MFRTLAPLLLLIAPSFVEAQQGRGRDSLAKVWKTLAGRYDKDQDGRIDFEEYPRGKERFLALDRDADGTLTTDDFKSTRRRSQSRKRGDELVKGDVAPDFELPFAKDAAKAVRLSSFVGERPVALIFGSYT